MDNGKTRTGRLAASLLAVALLALPGLAAAAEMEHGGMMKMGDKVFGGPIGPWDGEVRLVDMKAQMDKAKGAGMKVEGMTKSHHLAVGLSDPKTKNPVSVTEGSGTVTVTGPDKKEEKTLFKVMEGHFGADVNLPNPGKYTIKTEIETGGRQGSATFTHTVK